MVQGLRSSNGTVTVFINTTVANTPPVCGFLTEVLMEDESAVLTLPVIDAETANPQVCGCLVPDMLHVRRSRRSVLDYFASNWTASLAVTPA